MAGGSRRLLGTTWASRMNSRKIVAQFTAAIVASVFAGGMWLTGSPPQFGWLRYFSIGVWLAVIALFCWDKFIWRLAWIQCLPKVPRDLRGTWKGQVRSLWVDPETGSPPEEKEVYLVVRQDATSISTVLFTDESRSVSTVANLVDDGTVASLDFMYLNRPSPTVEHRSRMHHGSTSLDIIGRPVSRLSGRYWTDRDSRGEIEFVSRCPERAEGYEEAVALFPT